MSLKDLSISHSTLLKLKVSYEKLLKDYLPAPILSFICSVLAQEKVYFIIAGDRTSKLGDYHFNPRKGHIISINDSLNSYSFAITLIHELAHLKAFKVFSSNIKPHGQEWKDSFIALMYYPLRTESFPDDIKIALMRHMKNPKASSVRDIELRKVLIKYDDNSDGYMLVDDIDDGLVFQLKTGEQFIKKEKLRTRYKCENIRNGRLYYVSRTAEAKIIR